MNEVLFYQCSAFAPSTERLRLIASFLEEWRRFEGLGIRH